VPRRRPWRRLPAATLLCTAVLLSGAPTALASGPFPLEETFESSGFGSALWHSGGSAELTAVTEGNGNGWLRLTRPEVDEFGYVFYNEAFPSNHGVLAEFEYADYGGSGADGLTFFLYNGSVSEGEFHPGYRGGSLGYASCKEGATEYAGLSKAYVGVGFDEYGNFTNLGNICGLDGTTMHPNYVSVRGSEEEGYRLIAGASKATAESLEATRGEARKVTVVVTPEAMLDVFIRYPDGTVQTIVESFQLPKADLPSTLKFGFAASTGSLTDDHEIRHAKAAKPTQLTPSVSQTGGGHARGESLTWTATVTNEGPNETQSERVTAQTNAPALEGLSWTCEGAGGATCGTESGTGLPNVTPGAMPVAGTLTYRITGEAPPSDGHNIKLSIKSEPLGETGEMYPAHEEASVTTTLVPLINPGPTFTLSAGGEATATPGTVLGEEVSAEYHWQRCEPNGESCVDIVGAEATTYHTTTADLGHTLRFAQTARNAAGSATATSTPYLALPTTVLEAGPSGSVSSSSASFRFSSPTSGATFECELDGGAWSACTSEAEYAVLGEGAHSFSVRAVYGGLSDPTPPVREWTVETTPPERPTINPGHASPSPSHQETFTFGELAAGGTLECAVDGGEWRQCSPTTEFTGLTTGEHTVQARQRNKAGVGSEVASYSWTISEPAPPPPATGGGESETTPPSAPKTESTPPSAPKAETTQPSAPTGGAPSPHKKRPARHKAPGRHRRTSTRRRPAPSPQRNASTRHRRSSGQPKTGPATPPPPPSGASKGTPGPHGRQSEGHRRTSTSHRQTSTGPRKTSSSHQPTSSTGSNTAPASQQPTTGHGKTPGRHRRTPPRRDSPSGRHTRTSPHRRTSHPAHHGTTHRHHTKTSAGHGRAPRRPLKLTAQVPARVVAKHNVSVKVRCAVKGGSVRTCTVHAYHRAHSRWVLIGSGHTRAPQSGRHTAVVTVTLNRRGQHLLKHRLRGIPVTLRTTGTATAPAKKPRPRSLSAKPVQRRVVAENVAVLPIVWPFATARSRLVGRAKRIVDGAASELPGARTVTCVGYTDNRGGHAYNLALGLRRASIVCSELKRLGVHAHFRLLSEGAAHPRATNSTAAGRELNRRVELRVTF